jgi:DNA-binding NtrC family response regulator
VQDLAGRLVLIVEDEPIILFELKQQFEDAGAQVLSAREVQQALVLAEHAALSAGLLDYRLGDETTTAVCHRLKERNIPFVVYSGYDDVHEACRVADVIDKPADSRRLVEAVARLFAGSPLGVF